MERMDGALAANLAVGAAVVLGGPAPALAVVGLLSAKRLRSGRLAWVGLAFLAFAAQGAALAWAAYERRGDIASGGSSDLLLLSVWNLVIVVLLYFAVLKR
jgi:hypothetical protein